MWNLAILITGMVIATFSLSGCLIIPTDYYRNYSRENVTEEPLAGIVTGTTTREEVLIKLGEPDKASQDETELWYIASKVKGAWAIYGGAGGEFKIDYIHIISFDKNGFVDKLLQVNTIEGDKHEFWSNEFGVREFELSYYPEPHFSKSPIILPVKKE